MRTCRSSKCWSIQNTGFLPALSPSLFRGRRNAVIHRQREYIFLRMHPFNVAGSKLDNSTSQLDHVDGNGSCLFSCLFNVLSVLSVGSHVLSVELRVPTCLEPVNHGPLYKRMDSQFLMIFGKFRQSTTGNVGICASQECFHLPGLCTQHPLWCSDR